MFTLKDAVDLLESRLSRANSHWSFLLAIDLAVIGWLASRSNPIEMIPKLLVMGILGLVYVLNLWAILRAQREMLLFDAEIKAILKAGIDEETPYAKYLSTRSFQYYPLITVPVYLIGNGLVCWSIWEHPW